MYLKFTETESRPARKDAKVLHVSGFVYIISLWFPVDPVLFKDFCVAEVNAKVQFNQVI